MKTYKDINNKLWAYELDGSQDDLIPSEYIQITDEEADIIRAEQQSILLANTSTPTVADLMIELQALTAKIQALGATV